MQRRPPGRRNTPAAPAEPETRALSPRAPATPAEGRDDCRAFDRPLVPMVRLPDGSVLCGLGALARIGDLMTHTTAA